MDKRISLAAALLAGVILLSGMPGSASGSTQRPPADDPNKPPAPRQEVRPPMPERPPEVRPEAPPIEPKPVPPPKQSERPPEPRLPTGTTPSANFRSASGITAEQVAAYLADGYTFDEIMRADAIAARHGRSVADILAARRSGKTWGQIVSDLARSGQSTPVAGAPSEELILAVAAETGLTVDEVNRYLDKGFTPDDVTNAHYLAQQRGLTLNSLLARKRNRTWAEVNRDLQHEAAEVPEIAKESGFQPQEINALLEAGHALADVRQAALIAKVAQKSIAEVLALRDGRSWLEVAMELVPAEIPAEKGGN